MIRNIKFRAWTKEQKQMVEVVELNFYQATMASIYGDYASGEREWDLKDFENVELMQYVGLKDKNGTEIYEGDVIVWEYNEIPQEVKWDNSIGGYSTKRYHLWRAINKMEVIGNIYENPELLQEEK